MEIALENLVEKDLKYCWHPFTQMKGAKIIPIVRGQGVYVWDADGKKYIDAVSSWWVNVHGHSNRYIADKVYQQFLDLEHVIYAGFTHPRAAEVGERLVKLLPSNLEKIFFSDNGSTAVEVALKIALQYWELEEDPRDTFIAFEGSYHGDTFGSMSVSQRSSFTQPFERHLFNTVVIDTPTKDNLEAVKDQLKRHLKENKIAGFVFEPLIQGVRGMAMHSAELLDELLEICREHGVLLIADEVMSGFGRTGKMFACDHLKNDPDLMCMSKGISGGCLAIGVTAASQKIYDRFYSDDRTKSFFHGHSYSANALTCAAVCASLDLFEKEETWSGVNLIGRKHVEFVNRIKSHPGVSEARSLGTVLALELSTDDSTGYFNKAGTNAYDFFLEKGLIMRPIGNILIVAPPYCINDQELDYIYQSIEDYLNYSE